jgi:hypothetical protein
VYFFLLFHENFSFLPLPPNRCSENCLNCDIREFAFLFKTGYMFNLQFFLDRDV